MPRLSDDADSNGGDWSQPDYRTRHVQAPQGPVHARLHQSAPKWRCAKCRRPSDRKLRGKCPGEAPWPDPCDWVAIEAERGA